MEQLLISFKDYDTTLESVRSLAKHQGITPEELVHRAIARYLGSWDVKEIPEGVEPKSLREFFELSGIYKPRS